MLYSCAYFVNSERSLDLITSQLEIAGGMALTLEALGQQFKSLLNVTIFYPNTKVSFRRYLSGQLREVTIDIEELPIPRELLDGNYQDDDLFRSKVQVWINEIWQRKDRLISDLKSQQVSDSSFTWSQL